MCVVLRLNGQDADKAHCLCITRPGPAEMLDEKRKREKKSWAPANTPVQVHQTTPSEEDTTNQIRLEEAYTMRALVTTALVLGNSPTGTHSIPEGMGHMCTVGLQCFSVVR